MTPEGFPESAREKDMYRQLTEFITYWINNELDMDDIAEALARCSRDMKKACNMLENMSREELEDKIEELQEEVEHAFHSYPEHPDNDEFDEPYDRCDESELPPDFFDDDYEEPVDPAQIRKILNTPNLTFEKFMIKITPPDEGGSNHNVA